MILTIAIAIVAVLLGGFILLTAFEKKKGTRILVPLRARLDVYAINVVRTMRNIDMNALAYTKLRALAIHIGHEIAHGVLITIRALERLLTRTVRTLRHKKEEQDSGEKMG